jgi:hypothetical protein
VSGAVVLDPALACVLRAALAVVLAGAAVHKLRDPAAFRAALAAYRLLPAPAVTPAAALLVAAELAAAGALLGALRHEPLRVAALGGAALLGLYGAAIAVNLRRGRRHIDCGCAGPGARRPIHEALVARNAVLAALALGAALPAGGRALGALDALTVPAGTAALLLVYASSERLLANAPALAALRGRA